MPICRALILSSVALLGSLLMGCSSVETKESKGSGHYHEAAFNDQNTPPERFAPRAPAVAGDIETIDSVYMRTQADYYFSIGETYSLDGQYQKAIESYKTVLLYDPDSATVMLRLASEYLKLGMNSEATQFVESALKIEPGRVEGYVLLGGLYSSNKLYDAAIKQYETVLRLDPKNDEAPMYLGAVYAEKKQFDKAIVYFKKLSENEEYASRHLPPYYIGRILTEQGKYKEAELAYKNSLKQKNDFLDAALALGSIYGKMKQPEKAIEVYNQFQKENGPNLRLAEILSQVYIEEEKYDLAYEQLKILEEISEDILSVKVKMALILIEQKKFDPAIAKLKETLDIEPDSDKIRFYLAAVYEEVKDNENAIKEFKKIPLDSSYYSDSIVHAAFLLRQSDNLNEAIGVVEGAIAKKKDVPQFYALYASLLDEKKDYEKSLTMLTEATKLFPENAQLMFYLGSVYDKVGKSNEVVRVMKKVLDIDKNHVQALNYLAYTFAESKTSLPEAEDLARRALSLSQEDGYVMDTLGWVLYKQGRVKESIPYLQAAAKNQPQEAIILEHLGDAYYEQQMFMSAREVYLKLLNILPSDDSKLKVIQDKITAIEFQNVDGIKRQPASYSPPYMQRTKPAAKAP